MTSFAPIKPTPEDDKKNLRKHKRYEKINQRYKEKHAKLYKKGKEKGKDSSWANERTEGIRKRVRKAHEKVKWKKTDYGPIRTTKPQMEKPSAPQPGWGGLIKVPKPAPRPNMHPGEAGKLFIQYNKRTKK